MYMRRESGQQGTRRRHLVLWGLSKALHFLNLPQKLKQAKILDLEFKIIHQRTTANSFISKLQHQYTGGLCLDLYLKAKVTKQLTAAHRPIIKSNK